MWRLAPYIVGAALLIAALWVVNGWRMEAAKVPAYKAALIAKDKRITQEMDNARKANEASDGYQKDLAELQRASLTPFPSVRLCKRAPVTTGLPASGATRGSDAAAPGLVAEAPKGDLVEGSDLGPDLLMYGIACEANALQLGQLQKWVRDR